MPGLYAEGDYDLAGFAVGAVERGALAAEGRRAGDVMFGLPSSGVHSNGFSLVRRIVERAGFAWNAAAPFEPQRVSRKRCSTPTRIYVKPLLAALKATDKIVALAHITGGGFPDNLPRVLPKGLGVALDLAGDPGPAGFGWLAQAGGVAQPRCCAPSIAALAWSSWPRRTAPAQAEAALARRWRKSDPHWRDRRRDGEERVVMQGSLGL